MNQSLDQRLNETEANVDCLLDFHMSDAVPMGLILASKG